MTEAQTVDSSGPNALLFTRGGVYAVFLLLAFFFWGVRYADYLYAVREFSLFPPTWGERWAIFTEPGGFLELFALLFSSLFEYPALGAAALAFLGAAIQTVAYALWRDASGDSFARFCLAFCPSFLVSALFVRVGLDAFESNHATFFLEPSFGVLFALGTVAALRRVEKPSLRRSLTLAFAAGAFPFLGVYAFVLAGAAFLEEIRRLTEERRGLLFARADAFYLAELAFGSATAPLLWGYAAWGTYGAARLYRAALVEETTVSLDPYTGLALNALLTLLAATLVIGGISAIVALVPRRGKKEAKRAPKGRGASKKDKRGASGITTEGEGRVRRSLPLREKTLAAYAVLAILSVATFYASPRSDLFFATTAAARSFWRYDWDGVIAAERTARSPSDALISMRNLALFRRGELGERLFERPAHELISSASFMNSFRILGAQVLEGWGYSNLASRTASNNYVATVGRSVPATKTLAFTAIDRGDFQLARKYIARLRRSLSPNDRNWARRMAASLDKGTRPPRDALPVDDYIERGIYSVEQIVSNGLARRSDISSSAALNERDRAIWEARLSFALLDGNFETFSSELEPFWIASGKKRLPKSFQEGALFLDRLNQLDADVFPIEPEIRKRFDDFVKYVELYQKVRDQNLLDGMKAEYGDTAWPYFLFQGTDGTR